MSIEQLNSKEYFKSYYEETIDLTSYMNLVWGRKYGNEFEQTIEKYLNCSFKHKQAVGFLTGLVFHNNFKTLKELFSNSYTTNKLGEGRATVFFLKICGKVVMLFRDSRGTSIEIEQAVTKKEFHNIMFELFKIIYEKMCVVEKEHVDQYLEIIKTHENP